MLIINIYYEVMSINFSVDKKLNYLMKMAFFSSPPQNAQDLFKASKFQGIYFL